MKQLTPEALKEQIKSNSNMLLLDVRESWEFEICHIPGSINISMNDIPASLDELEKEQPVAIICHHGMRSLQVAEFLEASNFSDVMNLSGGIHAWADAIDTDMPRY